MSGGRGKSPLPRVCSRSSDAGITGCEVWSIEYVSCMQCIVCRVFQKTLLASLSCSELVNRKGSFHLWYLIADIVQRTFIPYHPTEAKMAYRIMHAYIWSVRSWIFLFESGISDM